MIKLGFQELPEGGLSLILSQYHSGDGEVLLTGVFGDTEEVQHEFNKLKQLIANAKTKALKLVTPEETKRRMDKRHIR